MQIFKKNNTKIIFTTIFFLVFFILPLGASAINLNINYPAIPYPGGEFDLNCLQIGSCELTIGSLFLFIYLVAIWIGGIIATIVLIQVGFNFIVSGNNAGVREKAKERFKNVLLGLIILLTATIVLNIINPDITNLKKSSLFVTDKGDFDCVVRTNSSCDIPKKGTFNYRCTVGFVPSPNKCPSSLSASACSDIKFQQCVDEKFGFGDLEAQDQDTTIGYGTDIEGCLRNEGYTFEKLQLCTNNCIDGSGGATVCIPIAAKATIKLCIEINGENEGICLLTNCTQWLALPGVDPSNECSTAWADATGAPSSDVPNDFVSKLENACVNSADGLPAGCTVENTSSNSVTCRVPSISNNTACYENFRNTCNSYGARNETSLTDVSCGSGVNDCVLNTCIYTGE